MKSTLLLIISQLWLASSYDLIVGTPQTGYMVKEDVLNYSYFPFMVRVKQYAYSGPEYQKIVGIEVLDNLHSRASATITAGGLDHSFVNIRMQSERGTGLEYDVRIFVKNQFS
ncbi:uncharacterized protein LOC114350431 [Ostrinia furnacalis]|uniref:uncharacterized protein LOC114350431 n=1 Tax=Ostrinia furnacalis TaxID=93504 RepID=UPI00103DE745|nr:uncharacterized protein LOC114350431 [Ostrinia furnacalis]